MLVTGLDIGESYLKIVQLKKGLRGIELVNLGGFRLFEQTGRDEFVKAIKKENVLSKFKLSGSRIITSIPRHLSTVRYLKLPTQDPKEIRKMLPFEAQKHLSFPLDEVEFDFYIVGHPSKDTSEILFVALQKEVIQKHLSLLNEIGLEPDLVDLSPFSLYRANREEETLALLDIDEEASEVCIVSRQGIRLTMNIPLTLGRLRGTLARKLKIERKEAEEIMSSLDLEESRPEVRETVESWIDHLVREIRFSLEAYLRESDGDRIGGVILSGWISGLNGISDLLSERLNLDVRPSDPFLRIRNDRFDPKTLSRTSALSIATGLALRGFEGKKGVDLRPSRLKSKQKERSRKIVIFSGLLLAGLLLGLGLFALSQYSEAKRVRLLEINQRFEQISPRFDRAKQIKMREDAISEFWGEKKEAIDILREVSLALPGGVLLRNFSFEKGKPLVLAGETVSYEKVARTIASLEQSPYFERVTPRSSRMEEGVIHFQIKVDLK